MEFKALDSALQRFIECCNCDRYLTSTIHSNKHQTKFYCSSCLDQVDHNDECCYCPDDGLHYVIQAITVICQTCLSSLPLREIKKHECQEVLITPLLDSLNYDISANITKYITSKQE